jgi:hypothetical protein
MSDQFSVGNAISGIAQMGQQGIQNALTRQQYTQNAIGIQNAQAGQAANALVSQAIDPATGTFSPSKYNQLLASSPAAKYAALAASQAGATNQQTALSNQSQQMQNGIQHFRWGGNLASAYSVNPPTIKQMQSDVADGINSGMTDAADGAQMMSQVPFDQPVSAQKAFWQNIALRANAQAGQIAQSLAQMTPVSGPGGTTFLQTNQAAPGYNGPGTVVTPGAPPTTTIVDPNNPTQTKYLGNAPPVIIPPGGPPNGQLATQSQM